MRETNIFLEVPRGRGDGGGDEESRNGSKEEEREQGV